MDVETQQDRIAELEHAQRALVGAVVQLNGQVRRLKAGKEELRRIAEILTKRRSWGLGYEVLGAVATVIAVTGVVLNNGKIIWCFPVWMTSNGITLYLHVRRRMWSLAARDAIFIGLAAAGWRMWMQ